MSSRRGTIMVWTILFVGFIIGWSSTGLQRSSTEHRAAVLDANSYRAVHLADAGLEQVIQNLRTIDGNDDVFTGTLPTGTFTIDQPLAVLEPLLYEAHIHGSAGNVERSIEAVLHVEPLSLFRFAMFGDDGVTVGGTATTDSFDSRNGPYDPATNSGSNGNIGTNGTAVGAADLNGGSLFIDGQISVGPGVDPPESIVDGFNPALISANPPVVSQPEYPLPEVKIPQGVTCNDLSLQGSTVWTLSSPGTYCFRNLHVKGGATLTSDGPVTIYLTESLNFEGESTIGVVNDPTKFLFLMASGSNVTIGGAIEGEAQMFAAMYGPDATIAIAGDAIIYGSVIGNNVSMAGDSRLHYDEALADMDTLSNEGIVTLRSWRTEE
jgi:hypothetical protein